MFLAAFVLAATACGQGDAVGNSLPTVDPQALQLELTGRVVDQAQIISEATEKVLMNRLAALEDLTSDQLVVVTVPSLNGQSIDRVSLDLANRWGVGQASLDNGVLLMVAPNERKVRIQVGYGLEGLLTDQKAAEIVGLMLPEFRAGQLERGVVLGVDRMEGVLKSNKRRPQPRTDVARKAA